MKNILLFIICITGLACQKNKDEAKPSNCVPQRYYFKFTTFSDEFLYEYTSDNTLTKIFQVERNTKILNKIIIFNYNNNRQLTRVSDSLPSLQRIERYYILEYAGTDKNPSSITEYNPNGEKFDAWAIEYNDGRIIKTVPEGFFQHRYRRYEYDSDGNVIRIFYRDPIEKKETLAMENAAFDDKKLFYSGSTVLSLYNHLIAFRVPGEHNPGKTIYHYISYGEKPAIPIIRNFEYQYNKENFPEKIIYSDTDENGNPIGGFTQQEELFNYICN
jgi:hypothetical protein